MKNPFATYDDRTRQALQEHIAGQVRALHPDVPEDASAQDVLAYHKHVEAPTAPEGEFNQYLTDTYGKGFKQPQPNVPETIGLIASRPELRNQVGRSIAEAAIAPIGMAFTGPAVKESERALAALPDIKVQELRSKGFTPEQIHHLLRTNLDLRTELQGNLEAAQEKHNENITNTMALAGTMGAEALAAPVMGAVSGVRAAQAAGKVVPMASKLINAAGKGAAGFAAWGGTAAAAQGKSRQEIMDEAASQIVPGAIIGPVMSVGGGIMKRLISREPSATLHVDPVMMKQQQDAAFHSFRRDVTPNQIGENFKNDIDLGEAQGLTDLQVATNISDHLAQPSPASARASQSPEFISLLAEKIRQYRVNKLNAKLALGNVVDLPTYEPGAAMGVGTALPNESMAATIPNDAVPPGTPLGAAGGLAPENAPPAVQGPIGERQAPFVPPAAVPAAPEGMEQLPPPQAIPQAPEPLAQTQPQFAPPAQPVQPMAGLESTAQTVQPATPEPNVPPAVQGPVSQPTGPPAPWVRQKEVGAKERAQQLVNDVRGLGYAPHPTSPIRQIGNVEVQFRPSADGMTAILDHIESLKPGAGEGAAVLKKITALADERQVPIEVTAFPLKKNGGRMPVEKLVKWYEKHGFNVIDRGPGWASLRREPGQPTPPTPMTPKEIGSLIESHLAETERLKNSTNEADRSEALMSRTQDEALKSLLDAMGHGSPKEQETVQQTALKQLMKDTGLSEDAIAEKLFTDHQLAKRFTELINKNQIDPATIEQMVKQPHLALQIVTDAMKSTPEQVRAMIDAGTLHPMRDAGLLDKVSINRDGTVWEYVEPTKPSYNTTKLLGRLGGQKTEAILEALKSKKVLKGQDVLDRFKR